MNSAILVCAILAAVGSGMTDPDVVVLKNGDRITGAFVSVRGRSINLQTGALGTLTIPLGQVASVAFGEMVTAVPRAGEPRSGWLTLGPTGNWQITDDNSETQIFDATTIDVILPIERYQSIVDHVAGPFRAGPARPASGTASSTATSRTTRSPAPWMRAGSGRLRSYSSATGEPTFT